MICTRYSFDIDFWQKPNHYRGLERSTSLPNNFSLRGINQHFFPGKLMVWFPYCHELLTQNSYQLLNIRQQLIANNVEELYLLLE